MGQGADKNNLNSLKKEYSLLNIKIDPKGKPIPKSGQKRLLHPKVSMSEEDDSSGSEGTLGSSPSVRSVIAEGSDLFKKILDDYVLDESRVSKAEMERYKKTKGKKDLEDSFSRRCERCQCVITMCKCNLYGSSRERVFGHRVHWADEVWDKPLKTYVDSDHALELPDAVTVAKRLPKPILKHRATCVIIVSE